MLWGFFRVEKASAHLHDDAAAGTLPAWRALAGNSGLQLQQEKARGAVAKGAFLPTRLQLLSSQCGSVVRYRAQSPDRQLEAAYRSSAQRIGAEPWMAFAPAVLHGADMLSELAAVVPLSGLGGALGNSRAE